MKIALNIEYFTPERGGGESYAANFAKELVRRGHEVHVFTDQWDEVSSDITYHRVPVLGMIRPLRELSFSLGSALALTREQFDIIQGFGKSIFMDVYRPGGGVHREWFVQDLAAIEGWLLRKWKHFTRRASIRQAVILFIETQQYQASRLRRIIAVSNMVKRHIVKHYRVDPSMVQVIYNGVDLERFQPGNRKSCGLEIRRQFGIEDEVVLLFVANNFQLKGLRYLIKAAGELKRRVGGQAFKVLVVGRDREKAYVSLAEQLRCERQVIFAGSSTEVEKFYAAADVLVHPTFYDPCANVCLEALASGVPVITTAFNGIGEIITNEREGFVVERPQDVPSLCRALLWLLDARAREQASRAARSLAEQYPLSGNYEEVIGVYEDVLREKRSGK